MAHAPYRPLIAHAQCAAILSAETYPELPMAVFVMLLPAGAGLLRNTLFAGKSPRVVFLSFAVAFFVAGWCALLVRTCAPCAHCRSRAA